MKRFAVPVCAAAALAAGIVVPAHGAEHGWYVGTGVGYSKGSVPDDTISNFNADLNAAIPGAGISSLKKGEDGLMYQLFLGYSFTSFLALEATAFRLGDMTFNSTLTSPSAAANLVGSLEMWGGSLDVLGIIPLGDAWRVYGRAGVILVKSSASFQLNDASGAPLTAIPDQDETKWGWKLGAGVGYEFDSGVAFRAEYNYYKVDTAWGVDVSTQTISGTVLYRFK